MSRIHVTALLALSTLALPVSFAEAQRTFSPGGTAPTSTQGSTGFGVPHCQAGAGGSRMRSRKAEDDCVAAAEAAAQAELQAKAAREMAQREALQCAATTLTEYSQQNNRAHVTGSVSIASCPAGSAGTFDVVALVKDKSGEIKPLEFPEKWQRNDAGDAPFAGEYPIGDNVELVNVRIRNLMCTCSAAPELAPARTTTPRN
jgi:hypothetical protein